MNEHKFSVLAIGTNTGATASEAAVTGKHHFVTCVSGHTDKDSIIQVLDGTTVVWENKFDITLEGTSFHFPELCIPCTGGAKADAKLSSSTTDCAITINGYTIP